MAPLPLNRGVFVRHGLRCWISRRFSGELRGYVQVRFDHELHGETEALELEGAATGWRVIGNDMTCPNGTGLSGCVTGGVDTMGAG